jgi:hypothetical protein
MLLALGASPTVAVDASSRPATLGEKDGPAQAGSPDGASLQVASLREITSAVPTWAADGDAVLMPAGVDSGSASAAAQAEAWPLVSEPATWAYLIAGYGLFGACLRARRSLSTAAA